MVLEDDQVRRDEGCPIEPLGPTSAGLARQPPSGRRQQTACSGNPWEDDGPDKNMGGDNPPLENPPPEGGGGTGVPPGGGGDDGCGSSDNDEMVVEDLNEDDEEEDPEESGEEDPMSGQTGKEYIPKTEMEKRWQECL